MLLINSLRLRWQVVQPDYILDQFRFDLVGYFSRFCGQLLQVSFL